MKALIVDDEPSVRLLLSRVLRREVECTVSEATNGIEALDLLGRESFDFVVIDVMMPLMDGLETLEAIRNTPALRHLPVMVLSAVRDEARVRQLVALGISDYLTKPLRPLDAASRVQQFVASVASSPHAAAGRARLALPEGARLLVIDGDPAFRTMVMEVLGAQLHVAEAEGGAQGLRACLDVRPAAILLGQQLGAVPAAMFLRKLRSLPALAGVPVVLASDGGVEEPGVQADGVIHWTLSPDQFRLQFDRLAAGVREEPQLLGARPDLRAQMIAATQQVFGMMLGVEVVADPAEPSAPDETADLVRIGFSIARSETDLEFGITMSRDMSERVTALLQDGADVVTDEDIAAALREVSAIVGVRIQNALRGRGDDVTTSAPAVGTAAGLSDLTQGCLPVGFRDASGEVRFTTFLRTLRREAAAPVMPQARAS